MTPYTCLPGFNVHLVVNEPPLFQKGVYTHDAANITSQVSPAGCAGQVLCGVQPVCVDHKVAVRQVNLWRLAAIFSIEKLGQSPFLDRVNGIVVKPRAVGGHNYVMCLLCHIVIA